MQNKPIRIVVTILETRGDRAGHQYYGFRFMRCSDGAMVEGRLSCSGCESNLRAGLLLDDAGHWRNDYVYTVTRITERELNKLPCVGTHPDAIAAYVKAELEKIVA